MRRNYSNKADAMPVKREYSPSASLGNSDLGTSFSQSPSADGSSNTPSRFSRSSETPSPPPKKAKTTSTKNISRTTPKNPSPSKGRPGAKARLAPEAKRLIAERIVTAGVSSLDLDALERETGLNKQQVRSQLADNRQNLRKQLMELARSLQ